MPDKFDDLIADITRDAKPRKAMAHPLLRLVPVFIAVVLYLAGATYFLGVRMDLAQKFSDPVFAFEILMMAVLALSASCAVSWLSIPDMQGKIWVPAIPVTVLSVFVIWSVVRAMSEGMGFGLAEIHWNHCVMDAAIMGFVPALILVLFMRRGATTRPYLSGFMNVLCVTGLSYIGLRMTCSMDNIAHGTILHLIPFIALGIIVASLARSLFRW